MTTLAQAVTTSTQKIWGLSAPLAASTTHLQVDSEIVEVTNHTTRQSMFVAENPLQCRVKRGQAGTTAATHAQGATVTERIDPSFGAGGGGVSVTGPFAITFDTPGITTNIGAVLTTVPAGSLFYGSRCIVHTEFDNDRELSINAAFGDEHDYWEVDQWETRDAVTDGLAGAARPSDFTPSDVQSGAFFEEAGTIRVSIHSPANQGSADLYCLIGTPS